MQNIRASGLMGLHRRRLSNLKLTSPRAEQFLGPRGHNLNTLGRGSLVDTTCKKAKIWELLVQRIRVLRVSYEKLISPRAVPFLALG